LVAGRSWITGMSWVAGMSTPQHLHACSASPDLEATSASPGPQHALLAPDRHTSTPPSLHASIPLRLPTSRASKLCTSTSASQKHDSIAPELNTTTTTCQQHHTRALEASTRPLRASRAPYLYTSTSERLQSLRTPYVHVCTPAARLQSSRALEANNYMPAAPKLLSFIPLCLYVCTPRRTSRAPELHSSTSARLQHTSRAPELHTPLRRRLHTCITLAARLPSPQAPYLHIFTSPHLQRGPRAPDFHASTSLHLQRTSRPPCLHVATLTARLRTSRPYCLLLHSLALQANRV